MKLVTCLLQPSRLEAVKRGLWTAGFRGVSISPAQGLGLRAGRLEKEDDFMGAFSEKVRVEVACRDAELERLVETVVEASRTGRVGDGKIFVTELAEVVRVRTGERGEAAL